MALQGLSEDTIDDLLYFARTADSAELQSTLAQAAKELATPPHNILVAAKDTDTGNTTLHMAAANGHGEMIKLLLSLSSVAKKPESSNSSSAKEPVPFIDMPNSSGNTPLHWAALNGHLEIVKLLVNAGADLLVKNNAGHDVAYEAELAGKEEVVNWLLSAENYNETEGNAEESESMEVEESAIEHSENPGG